MYVLLQFEVQTYPFFNHFEVVCVFLCISSYSTFVLLVDNLTWLMLFLGLVKSKGRVNNSKNVIFIKKSFWSIVFLCLFQVIGKLKVLIVEVHGLFKCSRIFLFFSKLWGFWRKMRSIELGNLELYIDMIRRRVNSVAFYPNLCPFYMFVSTGRNRQFLLWSRFYFFHFVLKKQKWIWASGKLDCLLVDHIVLWILALRTQLFSLGFY